jgi:hypothetical protein
MDRRVGVEILLAADCTDGKETANGYLACILKSEF